ncbi:nickel ABC transporter substrate-binding protein [Kaistia nematophila]|uniref:Nickel ABC transporter substrate-binding protein n=1 Tax=Kaistia nematophila TaxID=2994654 RepID=A0A9X3DXV9_9HYPH|nr:nickel ABC transporter substrate-binding protein [Kaistia nematophila]MCX5567894.1 nickel ABC transporter substrate-binding protein [Kaistia nematophila]
MRGILVGALLGIAAAMAPVSGAVAETLNFSWPSNVGPLDPHGYAPSQMFAQGMVYESLVKYRPDGSVVPWLAASWTASEDGRTYVFRLRDDVTFANGERFDAAAVVANLETVMANRRSHDWLELIHQLRSVEALDDFTVELKLKDPYYPLLQELALVRPVRFLAPSQLAAPGGIKAPIGTGPWKLAETRLGEYDVFERNDRYWGEKPAYDRVVVKVIADSNTRAVALETGDIDLIYGDEGPITPDTFARLKAQGYQAGISPPLGTQAIALNTNKAPTSELAVRQAINHAIDKDTLIAAIYHGTQTRADTLFAPTVPYADIGLKPYGYDAALAASLLDKAGWTLAPGAAFRARDGQTLRVDLAYIGTDAVMKSVAEVLQADLAKVGIEATLLGEEANSFYARQTDGNFGMIFGSTWGAPYDPHAFVSAMRVPAHADYQAQLGLPDKAKIDAEIGQALTSTDATRRQALYTDILTRLHEEAVYLPLTYSTAMLVARGNVGNLTFGATSFDYPFADLKPKD